MINFLCFAIYLTIIPFLLFGMVHGLGQPAANLLRFEIWAWVLWTLIVSILGTLAFPVNLWAVHRYEKSKKLQGAELYDDASTEKLHREIVEGNAKRHANRNWRTGLLTQTFHFLGFALVGVLAAGGHIVLAMYFLAAELLSLMMVFLIRVMDKKSHEILYGVGA